MVRILHVLPGRLRLGFDAVKGRPDLAAKLHGRLEAVAGIREVKVDTRTGSVLLLFDPKALKSPRFVEDLSAALESLFPSHFAPGRVRFTSRRLRGHPNLARRVEHRFSTVDGIERVEIDPATGTCLVAYDPEIVTTRAFRESLGSPFELLVPMLNMSKVLSKLGLGR